MYPLICGVFSGYCTHHVSLSWFGPWLICCVHWDTQRYGQRLIGLRCTSLSRWARPATQPRLSPGPSFHMKTQRLCSHSHCALMVGYHMLHSLVLFNDQPHYLFLYIKLHVTILQVTMETRLCDALIAYRYSLTIWEMHLFDSLWRVMSEDQYHSHVCRMLQQTAAPLSLA